MPIDTLHVTLLHWQQEKHINKQEKQQRAQCAKTWLAAINNKATKIVLDGYDKISALPNNITVSADLSIRDWRSLKTIPKKWRILGSFDATGCSKLGSVPADLYVEHDFILKDCENIDTLPEEVLSWPATLHQNKHIIDITGTHIDEEAIENWLYNNFTGVEIIYPFSLEHAINRWQEILNTSRYLDNIQFITADDIKTWHIDILSSKTLWQFIHKLEPRYSNRRLKQQLAKRLAKILSMMHHNQSLRSMFLDTMFYA